MAFIMNEFEVESAQIAASQDLHRPNLQAAVLTLARLVDWTNSNSDGWPYWRKPSNASTKLQQAVYDHYFGRNAPEGDLSAAQLKSAYSPIKAFLTRQGVAHSEIFIND